jgi:hypothetical protein
MSAFDGLYGTIRLRASPEVTEIIAGLKDYEILDTEIRGNPRGVISVTLGGCGLLSHSAGIELQELVKSLGPYTLEPAILAMDYEHEEDILVVAQTEEAANSALSQHRLKQIVRLLQDVSPQDRVQLAQIAAQGASQLARVRPTPDAVVTCMQSGVSRVDWSDRFEGSHASVAASSRFHIGPA